MSRFRSFLAVALAAVALPLVAGTLPRPEEGLWPFDRLPAALAKSRAVDGPWLEHLRRSAVKLPWGSGAFVSRDGLVITNHHVVRRWLQQVSKADRDLVKDGFVAPDRGSELRIPGLTARTLEAMEDVTAQVNRAVKAGMDETAALHARRVAFAAIKQEVQERTQLACEQVTFHGGAQYWIYGYRRHNDVRLVMSAEQQVAFLGGMTTNYAFPRHALDLAFLRIYERERPYQPAHFLGLAHTAPQAGEMTYIAGHPGRTQRRETLAQMQFNRDVSLPWRLAELERQERVLRDFADRSPEHAREVRTMRGAIENGLQKYQSWLSYLNDPEVMGDLATHERALRDAMAKRKDLSRHLSSFGRIERALATLKARYAEYQLFSTGDSCLLSHGLLLHRLAVEPRKPSAERLPEYQDAYLAAQQEEARSTAPINQGLERHILLNQLIHTRKVLGASHPFVKALLCGRTPEALVEWAVTGSRIHDPAFRIALLDGGPRAIHASRDPFLVLARKLDPLFRTKREWVDRDIHATLSEHLARIGKVRFSVQGQELYPDGNGTLRLSFGVLPVVGEARTRTTFGEMQALAAKGGEGWALPPRWQSRANRLTPGTPLNFVCRADVASGSSGSPMVNGKGELIGLVFDGNRACLNANFNYDAETNLVIGLDTRAILEALGRIYEMPALVAELQAPATGIQNTPGAFAEVLPRPRGIRLPKAQ